MKVNTKAFTYFELIAAMVLLILFFALLLIANPADRSPKKLTKKMNLVIEKSYAGGSVFKNCYRIQTNKGVFSVDLGLRTIFRRGESYSVRVEYAEFPHIFLYEPIIVSVD